MSAAETPAHADGLSRLPAELGLLVLSHLEPRSLALMAQCSRRWRDLVCGPLGSSLWRAHCRGRGWDFAPASEVGWMWGLAAAAAGGGCGGGAPRPPPLPLTAWKRRYGRLDASEREYGRGTTRNGRLLGRAGHGGRGVMQYVGPLAVGAFADSTVGVWKSLSGDSVYRLQGHARPVTTLSCHSNLLCTGSADRTARLWDLRTGGPRGRWVLPSAVKVVRHNARNVITGEETGAVCVWEIPEAFEEPEVIVDEAESVSRPAVAMVGHKGAVLDIVFDGGNLLVSSSRDNTVRIWRMDTGVILYVLGIFFSPALCLHLAPAHDGRLALAAGYADGSVRAWRAAAGSEIGSWSPPSRRGGPSSGSYASAVHCLQIISSPEPHVTCEAMERKVSPLPPFLVAVGTADGWTRVLDLNEGDIPLMNVQADVFSVYSLEVARTGRWLDDLETMEAGQECRRRIATTPGHPAPADLRTVGMEGVRRGWVLRDGGKCTGVERNADTDLLALAAYSSYIELSAAVA